MIIISGIVIFTIPLFVHTGYGQEADITSVAVNVVIYDIAIVSGYQWCRRRKPETKLSGKKQLMWLLVFLVFLGLSMGSVANVFLNKP
jgi:hypothetical protein